MRCIPGLRHAALVAALWTATATPAAEPELLRAEEAFRYEVVDTGDALRVDWTLADGYYLYRAKLGFSTPTAGVELQEPELPEGLRHEDEFFGVQQVYRGSFSARIPYETAPTAPADMELVLRSQGCADIGICYPPQTWTATVALSADAAATRRLRGGGGGNSLVSFGGASDEFLPVDEAFRPMLAAIDGSTIEVSFQVAPGYYLYKEKLAAEAVGGRLQLGQLDLPPGELTSDEYFGEQEVYRRDVFARLPLARPTPEPITLDIDLHYQGCAEDGICYPPVTRRLSVELPRATATDAAAATAAGDGMVSEQDRMAALIGGASLWLVVLTFFGAGLLLAFTPCVLPMIPILSGIIAGDRGGEGSTRGFVLALAYVLGMALVYTAAGIVAAAVGLQLQAVFNQPWVLTLFAALFVVLALAMFGAFELQVPAALQTKIARISGRQQGGSLVSAFVMGALSSLIVTACVAPPLVAALSVIGQSGDLLRGGTALFALSLGMGAPLLVVGASAGRLLPRAGAWMIAVRNAFGFMMLGLAVWMLSRFLPGELTLGLWGALAIAAGVWLGALTRLGPGADGLLKLGRAAGIVAMLYGAALCVGALAGSSSLTRPLAALGSGEAELVAADHGLDFRRVKTVEDLDRALAEAAAAGRPAMLDFYADWCVSCIEMEKYTFTDDAVQSALGGSLLLQADVTAHDAEDQALLEHFGVYGPPTIIFFGPDGVQRQGYEVVGYMKAARFAEHVNRAIGAAAVTAKDDSRTR